MYSMITPRGPVTYTASGLSRTNVTKKEKGIICCKHRDLAWIDNLSRFGLLHWHAGINAIEGGSGAWPSRGPGQRQGIYACQTGCKSREWAIRRQAEAIQEMYAVWFPSV